MLHSHITHIRYSQLQELGGKRRDRGLYARQCRRDAARLPPAPKPQLRLIDLTENRNG